jgi:hypothetical protein
MQTYAKWYAETFFINEKGGVGMSKIRTSKGQNNKKNFRMIRSSKIRTSKIRTSKIRTSKIRTSKIRTLKIS